NEIGAGAGSAAGAGAGGCVGARVSVGAGFGLRLATILRFGAAGLCLGGVMMISRSTVCAIAGTLQSENRISVAKAAGDLHRPLESNFRPRLGNTASRQTGTSAAAVIKDKVIVGISGGEFGVQCHVRIARAQLDRLERML